MANQKKDKTIVAVEAVHSALKKINASDRDRVLDSVRTLLGMGAASSKRMAEAEQDSASPVPASVTTTPAATVKPLAIRELIQDKKPRSHPQFITLFAYYREKHENRPSFSRDDLKRYYTVSREAPPANFDRDFVEAIKKGWIHEDGESSYVTSKGIEAVVSGFSGTGEQKAKKPKKSKGGAGKKKRA